VQWFKVRLQTDFKPA